VLDGPTYRLDPDAAITIQQPGAVQDGQHADVLGPPEIVRPQHEQVGCGQAFQAAWLGHDVTLLSLVLRDSPSAGRRM
jgi:hypothetical protein